MLKILQAGIQKYVNQTLLDIQAEFRKGKGTRDPNCQHSLHLGESRGVPEKNICFMWNAGLVDAQAGVKTAGRNISNLIYADDTTLMAESEEELKYLLMKVKEESEKVGLKLNIWKTKIIACSPITSWQIDRETMVTVAGFIFLGFKITADGDCSHEIKRLPGGKARQHIKKQRHCFANKGLSSQSYGSSSSHMWMWELDHKKGWAPKNWFVSNCGVGEDSWEFPGQQGDQTSPS